MTIRISPGLRAALLSEYGLKAMMDLGTINVYTGPQPATAALAPTGVLVARVTTEGLTFTPGAAAGGLALALSPAGGLTGAGEWRLRGVTTGSAGWWRWVWNAVDPGSPSLYYPRVDGAVGESLLLPQAAITADTNIVVDSFLVNFVE